MIKPAHKVAADELDCGSYLGRGLVSPYVGYTLGLTFNELSANAFKYAFPARRSEE